MSGGDMIESHAPPGQPFIIRWQDANAAVIENTDGTPLARLHLPPDGEPEVTTLVESATFEDRALICSALAWAVIEHVRGGHAV
jgi:hypothetical protein